MLIGIRMPQWLHVVVVLPGGEVVLWSGDKQTWLCFSYAWISQIPGNSANKSNTSQSCLIIWERGEPKCIDERTVDSRIKQLNIYWWGRSLHKFLRREHSERSETCNLNGQSKNPWKVCIAVVHVLSVTTVDRSKGVSMAKKIVDSLYQDLSKFMEEAKRMLDNFKDYGTTRRSSPTLRQNLENQASPSNWTYSPKPTNGIPKTNENDSRNKLCLWELPIQGEVSSPP